MTRLSTSASASMEQPGRNRLFVNRIAPWMMPGASLLLMLTVATALWIAKDWPLVHDAPLIHYVLFLMDHGWAPYRDIVEMNMPGAYIVGWVAMHGLGGNAFGWWLWDLLSGLAAVMAGAWIAGVGRRSAGMAGGALAYLIHLSDGPKDFGQRDWVVAVMLLVAFGCMFEAIRKDRAAWMTGFMGLCGFAASIKPPVIGIGICFLIATCWLERRRHGPGQPWARGGFKGVIGWSLVGGLVPTAAVAIFLARWGVTKEFIGVLRGLVPWYAELQRLDFVSLIRGTIALRPMFGGAILVFLLGRSWRGWESSFLAAATVAGAALFVIQGKGWNYHRYPEIAFGALWVMLELDRGLRSRKLERAVALVTLLGTVLVIAPRLLIAENASGYPMRTISHLERDLNSLGGAQLSGKIQCLDMTMGGCINVLYRMRLVQSTGFIYDYYLFPKHTNEITEPLQARFLREIRLAPPETIVLSSHTWPGDTFSYDQVANWPAFRNLLQQNYRLARELPIEPGSAGYQIYVLNEKSAK